MEDQKKSITIELSDEDHQYIAERLTEAFLSALLKEDLAREADRERDVKVQEEIEDASLSHKNPVFNRKYLILYDYTTGENDHIAAAIIVAQDAEEANKRLDAIKKTGRIDNG